MRKKINKLAKRLGNRHNITAVGIIVIIAGISITLSLIAFDYFRFKSIENAKEKRHSAYEDEFRRLSGLTVNLVPAPDPTADWKKYESQKYNISLKYPQNWPDARESLPQKDENFLLKVSFDENAIMNANGVKGFDVFIYSAAKFPDPAMTDNLKKKSEGVSVESCPRFDDITLGEKAYQAKEVNIAIDNPCWEETFLYSLTQNGWTFNIIPRQEGSVNIFEDRKKIDILREFPEFYDVVSTLDFAEVKTESLAQTSKDIVRKVTAAPKVRYTSGATCAHKKDKPRKSKNKGRHMDEDCCPDPDEWPNPRCAYSAKGLAIMLSPR